MDEEEEDEYGDGVQEDVQEDRQAEHRPPKNKASARPTAYLFFFYAVALVYQVCSSYPHCHSVFVVRPPYGVILLIYSHVVLHCS